MTYKRTVYIVGIRIKVFDLVILKIKNNFHYVCVAALESQMKGSLFVEHSSPLLSSSQTLKIC